MTRLGKVKIKSAGRGCETDRDTDDQGEGLLGSGRLETHDLVLARLEVVQVEDSWSNCLVLPGP